MDVCYCPFFLYGAGKETIIPKDYQDKHRYEQGLLDVLRRYNVVSTQTLVIHRDVVTDVGVFDEEMPRWQEYEYVIRIVQKKRIAYVAEPLVKVYRTKDSISNDDQRLKDAGILLLEKHRDFFDMEAGVEDWVKRKLIELDEKAFWDHTKQLTTFLQHHLGGDKINIYRIIGGLLYQQYSSCYLSCLKEYTSRVERLEDKGFAIYGAGMIGEKILMELSQRGLSPRCFLVTQKGVQDELYGIPVYPLEEWDRKDKEVIIGVAVGTQDELVENLVQMGYTGYFRYPDKG